jgi:hypothetical protein
MIAKIRDGSMLLPSGVDRFNLDATLQMAGQAATAVFCNIVLAAAGHGLILAFLVACLGLVLTTRKHRYGRPLLVVAGKIAIVCAVMAIPGSIFWLSTHHLPATGTFQVSSLGFLVFWSWISLHLCAEEMNFEWF